MFVRANSMINVKRATASLSSAKREAALSA